MMPLLITPTKAPVSQALPQGVPYPPSAGLSPSLGDSLLLVKQMTVMSSNTIIWAWMIRMSTTPSSTSFSRSCTSKGFRGTLRPHDDDDDDDDDGMGMPSHVKSPSGRGFDVYRTRANKEGLN